MPQLDQLSVTPIYGWGWTGIPPARIRETPQPFSMNLTVSEPGCWKGIVCTTGHEFEGMTAALGQRHYRWDGFVNVTVGDMKAPVTHGYAEIDATFAGKPYNLRRRLHAAKGSLQYRVFMIRNRLRRR